MIALPAWDATRWAVEIAGWAGAALILFAYLAIRQFMPAPVL